MGTPHVVENQRPHIQRGSETKGKWVRHSELRMRYGVLEASKRHYRAREDV